VTGSLELTTAVLLARTSTRLLGAALGGAVMLGALATVTLHGEYGHAVLPLVVMALTIVVGWINASAIDGRRMRDLRWRRA
jgi:hypothetical protein